MVGSWIRRRDGQPEPVRDQQDITSKEHAPARGK
jgi:hypothetical protein